MAVSLLPSMKGTISREEQFKKAPTPILATLTGIVGSSTSPEHPENAYGAWRIELTDPAPKTRNYFLNVIEVGSKEQQSMTKVEKIGDYGVRVKTADGTTYEAAFQPAGEVVCSLRAINPDGTERYKKLLKKNF